MVNFLITNYGLDRVPIKESTQTTSLFHGVNRKRSAAQNTLKVHQDWVSVVCGTNRNSANRFKPVSFYFPNPTNKFYSLLPLLFSVGGFFFYHHHHRYSLHSTQYGRVNLFFISDVVKIRAAGAPAFRSNAD